VHVEGPLASSVGVLLPRALVEQGSVYGWCSWLVARRRFVSGCWMALAVEPLPAEDVDDVAELPLGGVRVLLHDLDEDESLLEQGVRFLGGRSFLDLGYARVWCLHSPSPLLPSTLLRHAHLGPARIYRAEPAVLLESRT